MPSSARDLLALAERLNTAQSDEAALRCAISRAYYAALHTVDATFDPRISAGPKRPLSSHEEIASRAEVYAKGANPGRQPAASLVKLLLTSKRQRVRADYHLSDTLTLRDSSDNLSRCVRIIALCGQVVEQRTKQQADRRHGVVE